MLGWRLDLGGNSLPALLHQEGCAGALDLAGDLAMQVRCKSGHAAWQNFTRFRCELLEKIGIFEINGLGCDVEAAAWHAAVGAAEIGAALGCLWCAHGMSFVTLFLQC